MTPPPPRSAKDGSPESAVVDGELSSKQPLSVYHQTLR